MPYTLPPLPYPKEALEPHIDALTMEIHHDKHHAAYVNNVNKAIAGKADLEEGRSRSSSPTCRPFPAKSAARCATTAAAMPTIRCSGKSSAPKPVERLPAPWRMTCKTLRQL